MKIYVISDNTDTRTGLRLVGVDGVIVHTQEELKQSLDKVIADSDIGILLIVEKLARQFPDVIKDLRLNRRLPLVVEIPDRHGAGRPRDFITAYIRDAMGVSIIE